MFSGFEDRRSDKWWEVLNVNSVINSFKMEEEVGNWEWKEEESFALGNQREDLLGSSQIFD
jgi:hypothetical protein